MNEGKRLIYVYLGGTPTGSSSVQKKVTDQIEGLNLAGVPCEGWFFTNEVAEETRLGSSIVFKPLKDTHTNHGIFQKHRKRQAQIQQIHAALKQEKSGAYIFLRHTSSGRAYFNMLKDLGQRIFLYVPSNTLREDYHEFVSGLDGSWAGKIIKTIEYVSFVWWPEFRFYKYYTSKVRACVAFTPEFCKIIRDRSFRKVKTIYNRDGANASRVQLRHPSGEGHKVKLLFMKGSNSTQRWAGLDRLVQSIRETGKGRFELMITGRVFDTQNYADPFITLTGRISDHDLDKLIDEADLGVSNLANYLIDFQETTNMKSREYFMRGLPFIQANTMPDIEGSLMKEYYLLLPNNSGLLDMNRIYDFAMRMRNDKRHPAEMRVFAEKNLDWHITTGELAVSLRKEMI